MDIRDFHVAWDGIFKVITTRGDVFIGFKHADGRDFYVFKFDPALFVENEFQICSQMNLCLAVGDISSLQNMLSLLEAGEQQRNLCIGGKGLLADVKETLDTAQKARQQTVNNMKPLSAVAVKNTNGLTPAIPGIAAKSFTPGDLNRYPSGTVFTCTKSLDSARWTEGQDYTAEFDAYFSSNVIEDNNGQAYDHITMMEVQISIIPGYGPNPFFTQQMGRAVRERAEAKQEVSEVAKPMPKGYEPDEMRTDVDIMDLTRSIIGR